MRFVTSTQMKRLEQAIADTGVSYQQMMEAAGCSAAEAVNARWPMKAGGQVLVLCGKGNNGGDGFVAARRLSEAGGHVVVGLVCGGPATDESRTAFAQLPATVPVTEKMTDILGAVEWADIVIDAIFGTGFRGEVPAALAPLFAAVRRQKEKLGAAVVAFDLPSGVEADSGRYTDCMPADLTVAFGAVKPAHLVNWAGEYTGELTLGEIGMPPAVADAFDGWEEAIDSRWAAAHRPRRSHTSHKGSNGRLLLVAGSRQYPGAAVLAAGAAARTGVGYVRLASTARVCRSVSAHCPEVIYTILPKKEKRGGIAGGADNLSAILGAASGADAIAMGCGMEPGPDTVAIVKALLQQPKPLLLDAGALTALGETGEATALLKNAACPVVLTPHPGEYARLTGEEVAGNNPFDQEYTIAKEAGVTLLLKGWATGVTGPDGRRRWSFAGSDGLAKGGSGDVLTGVIGGLLARGMAPTEAALWGAWLHGEAARLCAGDWSREAMLPSQLPGYFGKVFGEMEGE